jgi:hypothetical protein
MREVIKIGKRGTVVLPAKLRRRSGTAATLVARARERAGMEEGEAIKLAIEETKPRRRR